MNTDTPEKIRSEFTLPSAQLQHIRELFAEFLPTYQGNASVRLWNGETVIGKPGNPTTLIIRNPAVLRKLVVGQDLLTLGEAFLIGDVDVDGPIEEVFELVDSLQQHSPRLRLHWLAGLKTLGLPAHYHAKETRKSRAKRAMRHNSRASIGHHYDVSNEFYRLWLDPEMVYSCAYFQDTTQSLAQAQCDKLDYICRKLRLKPGQKLLDIGCGWGTQILWAAKYYGVTAHGITLSREQYEYAKARIEHEDLAERVSVELCDYRELSPDARYDRIVSVGMFEHVGLRQFPLYFGKVRELLNPDGLFLNHGITNDAGWRDTPITRFVNRYVFPDGELTRIGEVNQAMEDAGFEIIDVENLRPHYELTCRRWVQRLEAASEQAQKLTNDMTYRIWRLYMAGSAHYFQQGSLRLYQVLASVADIPWQLPLRRDDLYTPDGTQIR